MVCLERLGSSYKTLPYCKHSFHQSCIDTWFQSSGKQSCPTCGHVYGISKGPQPSNGRMLINYLPTPLPGFEDANNGPKQGPTIEITYIFPSGIQGPLNPNPNQPFTGTTRKAYLPNNREGREILQLLKRAFDDQHIFTIGRSSTTGQENVVTWNDIHHKTSIYGGPER
jgi:deltex-like protein